MHSKFKRSAIAFIAGIITLLWPSSTDAKALVNAGPDKHPTTHIDTVDA